MLELTEVQEAFFMQLIESQLEASDELAEIQDVDNTLQGILTRLAPQLTAVEEDTGAEKTDSDDDLLYQDVEFF
jgi:hypothetical protein